VGVRWLIVLVVLAVAALIGINAGWRWVFAPLLAYGLLRWSIASLRVLVTDAKDLEKTEGGPAPVGGDERTMFWCEECGTEVMLLVRGSARAPSHCGQRMNERTEMLNN
jgi:hypothetical protein